MNRLCQASLASCLLGVVAVQQPVLAQESDPTARGGAEATDQSLPDIVVTATRRAQSLQHVPATVAAFSGDQLVSAGISKTTGLEQVTPGLVIGQTANAVQPTIRGVGTRGAGQGDESNIAMYIDGVYQPSMLNNNFDLLNIERVEVLKGPQGTLFGRNATGGAINVITRKPSQTFSGSAEASYGRYDTVTGSAYLTGPLATSISADLATIYSRTDGYIDDLVRGGKTDEGYNFAVRSRLRVQPTDAIDFVLAGSYAKAHDRSPFAFQPINNNTRARVTTPGVLLPSRLRQTAAGIQPDGRSRQWDINLTGSIDLGSVSLETSTDYQNNRSSFLTDSDATPANLGSQDARIQYTRAWSQELRLLSQGKGRFQWVIGGMAFQSVAGYDNYFSNVTTLIKGVQRSRAYSGFGEATLEAVDHLFLTAGLRYSNETRIFDPFVNVAFPRQSRTFRRWSPKAAIRYEFSPDADVYFSYTEGFKSGVYNATTVQLTPVNEEVVRSFEAGLKLRPAPWARANFSAFHYDYTGLQLQTRDGLTGLSLFQNAGKAKIDGAEAEVDLAPGGGFSLRLGAAWSHGRFTDFRNAQVTVPVVVNGTAVGGNTQALADVTGKDLIRAPRFTATAAPSLAVPAGSGELRFNANLNYNSGYSLDVLNRVKQPSYLWANANVSYVSAGDRFRVTAWAENLFNEDVVLFFTTSATGDFASYRKPVTYGVTIATKF